MKYGVGYVGSKNTIATDIINALPSGNRLIDLFGGGGAITHCATLSNKYNTVVYNDYDQPVVEAIINAICGVYNLDTFTPQWVSREDFKAKKSEDGYIKIAWSFSNNGIDYVFSKQVTYLKKCLWNYIILNNITSDNITDNILLMLFPSLATFVNGDTIKLRMTQFRYYTSMFDKGHWEDDIINRIYHTDQYPIQEAQDYFRSLNPHGHIKDLFRLPPIERLERFENLSALHHYYDRNQLIITCDDYRNYVHQTGDVVYCDIPYEQSANKMNKFNKWFCYQDFYDWALSRNYDVYFSSYYDTKLLEFADIIWSKTKNVLINKDTNSKKKLECLYKIKR